MKSLLMHKHKLDNLVIIVDYNKIQALSKLSDAPPLHNLKNLIHLIVHVMKFQMDTLL